MSSGANDHFDWANCRIAISRKFPWNVADVSDIRRISVPPTKFSGVCRLIVGPFFLHVIFATTTAAGTCAPRGWTLIGTSPQSKLRPNLFWNDYLWISRFIPRRESQCLICRARLEISVEKRSVHRNSSCRQLSGGLHPNLISLYEQFAITAYRSAEWIWFQDDGGWQLYFKKRFYLHRLCFVWSQLWGESVGPNIFCKLLICHRYLGNFSWTVFQDRRSFSASWK